MIVVVFKDLTVTDKRFKLQPTNPYKVFSLLNTLNKSKVTGLDKISARFVRECADRICVPICDIFNQSISQGTFPDDWKYARVTPLYKQGDRGDVNNRDLKQQDGRDEDGVPEVYFQVYSCAERKKTSAVSRRPHVDNAIFTVLTLRGQRRFPCQTFSSCASFRC